MSQDSGLTQQVQPIEEHVFRGVQKRFLETFGCPAVWTSSTDKVRVMEKVRADSSYPYAYLVLNSMTEAKDRHNSRFLSLRGTAVTIATDGNKFYRANLIPADFIVSVEYVTNSYKGLLRFSTDWMFARKNGGLNFGVQYGRTDISVSVQGQDSITFPVREGDLENVPEYLLTTDMTVYGWISQGELVEADVAQQLQVTGIAGNEKVDPVVNQFWKFPEK